MKALDRRSRALEALGRYEEALTGIFSFVTMNYIGQMLHPLLLLKILKMRLFQVVSTI